MRDRLNDYDEKDCAKAILKFLNKEFGEDLILINKLEKFKNWSFSWLVYKDYEKEDFYYGKRSGNFDEDDTMLANMIYFLMLHGKVNGLDKLGDIDGEKFRGETINTFNTLFQDNLLGIKLIVPFTEEYKDFYFKILQFREKYTTVGNFMLYPNISDGGITLNTMKMSLKKDYTDLFFTDLYPDGKLATNGELKNLVNLNKDYLPNTFKGFCENQFLEYYMENGKPIIKFEKIFPVHYWWSKNNDTKEYKEFAENYMNIATEIIEKRAGKICNLLENKIRNYCENVK